MQVPDAIDPAVGFRVWLVTNEPEGPRLNSLNHSALWQPGVPFEAICERCEEVPGIGCRCGTYARIHAAVRDAAKAVA